MTDKRESRSRDRSWSLILLSGGRSRRMGKDKAGLSIGGETFLARILRNFPDAEQRIVSAGVEQRIVSVGAEQRIVSAGAEQRTVSVGAGVSERSAEGLPVAEHSGTGAIAGIENAYPGDAVLPVSDVSSPNIIIVPDRIPDFGPLGGLEASLRICTSEYVFVTACDQPFMDECFAARLLSWLPDSFDAAVPVNRDGRIHPLSALYRTTVLRSAVEAQISEEDHRVRNLLERMRTMYVPADAIPEGPHCLWNVNTPEEYAELCAGAGAEERGRKTGNAAGAGAEERGKEAGNAAGAGAEELSYYERTPSGIPVFAVAAYSGTGKTTFLEKLIPELKRQRPGLRIGVVKHDVHGFTVDQEGKDTRRLADAGADLTAILNDAHAAVMEHRPRSVYEILEGLSELDLIFLEGFKKEPFRKILLYRQEVGQPLAADPAECFLVIVDPDFSPDKMEKIAAAVLEVI